MARLLMSKIILFQSYLIYYWKINKVFLTHMKFSFTTVRKNCRSLNKVPFHSSSFPFFQAIAATREQSIQGHFNHPDHPADAAISVAATCRPFFRRRSPPPSLRECTITTTGLGGLATGLGGLVLSAATAASTAPSRSSAQEWRESGPSLGKDSSREYSARRRRNTTAGKG
jgi:hypothetical protein